MILSERVPVSIVISELFVRMLSIQDGSLLGRICVAIDMTGAKLEAKMHSS